MKASQKQYYELPGGMIGHRAIPHSLISITVSELTLADSTRIMATLLDALNDADEWEPWRPLIENMALLLVQDSMTRTINGVTEYRYRKEQR